MKRWRKLQEKLESTILKKIATWLIGCQLAKLDPDLSRLNVSEEKPKFGSWPEKNVQLEGGSKDPTIYCYDDITLLRARKCEIWKQSGVSGVISVKETSFAYLAKSKKTIVWQIRQVINVRSLVFLLCLWSFKSQFSTFAPKNIYWKKGTFRKKTMWWKQYLVSTYENWVV